MTHTWNFFRTGGFDQVRLDTGADLEALEHLDQKLWVALACPSTGLEFDDATLRYIDGNGDGRIRAPEILAAVKWATARLRSADVLIAGADRLALADIDTASPDGARIHATAKQVLSDLGREGATHVAAADTADTSAIFKNTALNGDGVVPVGATDDEAVAQLLRDILACTEPATDRSGEPGVTRETVAAFFDEARAFAAWWAAGEADGVLPLGADTGAAADAIAAVATKVDDFFARCRLAAFDPRAVEALNREESAYLEVAAKDLSITPDEVRGLPLARVDGAHPLPLRAGLNPAWAAEMRAFERLAVAPVLGDVDALTEAGWGELRGRFAAFEAWRAGKEGVTVEALGLDRVQAILASELRGDIDELLTADEALREEADAIDELDKLIHLHRDLITLLRNFVNFEAFYDPTRKAIFQAGTLFLDQRSCNLCLRVTDAAKHGTIAGLSRTYLAYCACVRKSTGQTMNIVAAFTAGEVDNLMVGRNGVFYDRKGDDWDATITKIVENPLSIRQAFWAPYKRVLRFIEAQVAKRAEASDKDTAKVDPVALLKDGAKGRSPAAKPKFDVGVVAALGVAVGGLVAALGAILQVFFGLGVWMPLGLLGLMLVVSGPSMIIAALKLRQRNLGPLLDANGWAINAMARINVPFGTSLTRTAKLPEGAVRDLSDPFAPSRTGTRIALAATVAALVAGAWYFGALDSALPDFLDRATVLGEPGPASPQQ